MKPAFWSGLLFAVLLTNAIPPARAESKASPSQAPEPYKHSAHFSRRWNPAIAPERPAAAFYAAPLIYPEKWRTWGQPAYAVIEFLVLETGRTDEIQCTEATDRAFAKAAAWTIEHTAFTPALKDQQGVCSKVVLRLEFKLNAGKNDSATPASVTATPAPTAAAKP